MRNTWIVLTIVAAFVGSVYASDTAASSLGIFRAQQDIGSTSRAGIAQFNPGTKDYTVAGGGLTIGQINDSFHFVYAKVAGDATLSADVQLNGRASARGEIVLMFRQNLDANAPFASVALQGDGSTSLQYRPGTGVASSAFRVAMKAPSHLSISRQGHEFTIYAGNAGEEPVLTGPIVVTMQDPVYVGLGVCAERSDGVESATFSNVRLKTKGK